MTTTYISIDVAVRSLAVGVYRLKAIKDIDSYRDDDPQVMNENLNSIIYPIHMNVYDINHGSKTKDTSITEKATALKETLKGIDESIKDHVNEGNIRVLVEYQLNANHGANAIFNMIVMYYTGRYPVHIMKPSLKNTVAAHPMLTLSTFLGRCSSNYKANKEHTKHNMLYLLTVIDKLDLIKDIKKCNQDDIADTLMQCLAFHLKN